MYNLNYPVLLIVNLYEFVRPTQLCTIRACYIIFQSWDKIVRILLISLLVEIFGNENVESEYGWKKIQGA